MRLGPAPLFLSLLFLLCLSACESNTSSPAATGTAEADATSQGPATATAGVTALPVVATAPAVGNAPAPATEVTPEPYAPPHYDLSAVVDAEAHTLEVTAHITFSAPAEAEALFNLHAAYVAEDFEWLEAAVAGAVVTPTREGAWLRLPLPEGVEAGTAVPVRLAYRLTLPALLAGDWGWRSLLGYTPSQIVLGAWYPVLAPYRPGHGWVWHPVTLLGEYYTAPSASYDVRLAVTGYAEPPVIAGSGQGEPCGEAMCFHLDAARLVAYAISDQMTVESTTTPGGCEVTSVYFTYEEPGGRAVLATAAEAVDVFAALFGTPGLPAFTVVDGDFYDGMEYSGMAFVGRSYYWEYDKTPKNWLTLITVHEAAHQWWHTRVGSDPAAEPWLDEALSTYSELLYLETAHPDRVAWWWAFRVHGFKPRGAVNQPVSAFIHFRPYVDAVYLRGALMLHAMREAIGDEPFMAFLRDYAAAQAGTVATGADFWDAYARAGGDPAAIQAEFFQQ